MTMLNAKEEPSILFSVITITYRDWEGFCRTRDSVLGQSFDGYEWIVVDGGQDQRIREGFSSQRGSKHVLISEKDAGIYNAMNKGLAMASGKYVIFMNGGDSFATQDVLSKIAALASDDDALIYGDCLLSGFDGDQPRYKVARNPSYIWYGMFASHQSIFYPAKLVGALRFDERLRIAGDYRFTAEVVKKSVLAARYAGFPVSIFDMRGASNADPSIGRAENWMVQRDVLGIPTIGRAAIRLSYLVSWFLRSRLSRVYSFLMYK